MADANIIIKLVDQTRGGISSVSGNIDNLNRSAKNTHSNLDGMQKRIVAIGAAIATSFAVKKIIDVTARFEDLRDSLNTVTGSIENGSDAFKFIQDFATKSQFGVETLTETFIKLKAAGIEPTAELLTTFTDTAAVTTDQIGSLTAITDLFARTTSGGLGLEELNRLADRGIPVFKILEDQIGITRLEVSEFGKTSEGAREITEALIRGLNQEFGGATQDRLDNLSTAMSNFGIAVDNAIGVFGEGLKPALVEGTTIITNFISKNEELIASFGRLVGEGMLYVIENFDKIVVAAGAFFAVLAVSKIANIVTGIATLARGIVALNLTMATNPIGLALLAISGTIVLLYTQWDNLKAIATKALDAIVVSGLTLEKWFYEFLDIVINGVPNAFLDMGKRAANVMSALVAAAKDPFNAFEAFRDELKRGNEQLEDNRITVVDFSGKIEDLDRRIGEVSSSTDENTKVMGENADGTDELKRGNEQLEDNRITVVDFSGKIEDLDRRIGEVSSSTDENTKVMDKNADGTDDLSDTKDDLTDAAGENSNALDDNTDALAENEREARAAERAAANLRAAIERGTNAVNDSIKAYENETYAMGLGEDKKEDLMRLIDEEQRLRKEAGDEIAALTEEQIRQILELDSINEAAALNFIQLSDDQIAALARTTEARREATATRTRLAEQEREQARQTEEFTRDTERAIQRHYEDTTIKSQQLTDELEEYVQRARQQGKENDAEVQRAIRAYRYEINQEITKEYQDMIDEQVSAQNEFKSKFSGIYDDIFDKISDWTGKSRSELEKYSQYAELFLGVNPMNSLTNMVTNGLMGINNFATGGANQMGNFAGQTMGYMDATGNFIATNTFGQNGQAAGGIAGFVQYALQALGGGGGLFGVVTALFSGLGLNLQGIFSNVFSWIGNGLSGIGGFLGDIWGGIKSFGSSVFGGIGDFFGGLVSGVSNFFSGLFEDGGYIKPGTVGIVGEAGAELVSGPANVMSARDTAGVLGGGQGVNINFNIQAVDAKGIDQLLIERKTLIADVVRDAVSSSGRRI